MATERKDGEKDVLQEAEENLASIRRTLAAIDDLNKRWKVGLRTYSPHAKAERRLVRWRSLSNPLHIEGREGKEFLRAMYTGTSLFV